MKTRIPFLSHSFPSPLACAAVTTWATPAFPVAGFRYYDGDEVLSELQPGTSLTLHPQPDNPHDAFAVEILCGRTKLGYVPRFCNQHVSRLLQNDVSLACKVAHVRTDAPPWEAVAVRVSLNQPELQDV